MTELLREQGQAPPTPSLKDHTPLRVPMLPILEEEEWRHADLQEVSNIQDFQSDSHMTTLNSTLNTK